MTSNLVESVIPAAISMVQTELGRIEELRTKNRTTAIIVVGGVLAFSVKEKEFQFIPALFVAALVFTFLFWYQDYRLHRYRHGWYGVGSRIRKFIGGEIPADGFQPLKYEVADELKATFYPKSTGLVFLVLLVGSLAMLAYKWVHLQ